MILVPNTKIGLFAPAKLRLSQFTAAPRVIVGLTPELVSQYTFVVESGTIMALAVAPDTDDQSVKVEPSQVAEPPTQCKPKVIPVQEFANASRTSSPEDKFQLPAPVPVIYEIVACVTATVPAEIIA